MKNKWRIIALSLAVNTLMACQNTITAASTSTPVASASPCVGSCLNEVKDSVLKITANPTRACADQEVTFEGTNIKGALGSIPESVDLYLLSREGSGSARETGDKGLPPNPETEGIKVGTVMLNGQKQFKSKFKMPSGLKTEATYGILIKYNEGFIGSNGEIQVCQ